MERRFESANVPDEKTHLMLSCLAIPIIGNMVPSITVRKGTIPYTEKDIVEGSEAWH